MKHLAILCFATALAVPAVALGQTPAPVGHRQPTASEVPANNFVGTEDIRTGRSASRSRDVDRSDTGNDGTDTPRICTNCDD